MKSTIGELINQTIPSIDYNATVEEALNVMVGEDLEHIIVLNDAHEVVAIAEDIELEDESNETLLKDVNFSIKFKGVLSHLHIYEALKLMMNNSWEMIIDF